MERGRIKLAHRRPQVCWGGFPLSRDFSVGTRVNKIDTMYGRSRVNVKVEPRSTFTFTRDLSYIASISFTRVNFTCVRTETLRDSGNQPLVR